MFLSSSSAPNAPSSLEIGASSRDKTAVVICSLHGLSESRDPQGPKPKHNRAVRRAAAKPRRTCPADLKRPLVKNSAAILGPRGNHVNAVAPGVIDTDMSNFTKTEAGREVTLGMQALKRIGKPEDVADVVAFVACDDARWITGASIPVDGGSKL